MLKGLVVGGYKTDKTNRINENVYDLLCLTVRAIHAFVKQMDSYSLHSYVLFERSGKISSSSGMLWIR